MPEGIPYASTNVVAGAGLELNYIGRHCYAMSGNMEATTASQIALLFTTGSEYIVGEFQFNGFVQLSNVSVRQGSIEITVNSIPVSNMIVSDANEDMPGSETQKILLPPYTVVQCNVVATSGDSDNFATVTFIGKVYK